MATSQEFQMMQQVVLHTVDSVDATTAASSGATIEDYLIALSERAEGSTQAVILMFDNVMGAIPTFDRITDLNSFCRQQYDYYDEVLKVADPVLGVYEALGRALSNTVGFHAQSDGKSDTQFIVDIYAKAYKWQENNFGSEQLRHFQSQLDYLTEMYKGSGIPAGEAALQARGAVYGQILGSAATVEDSAHDKAAELWFDYGVGGGAVYAVPLNFSVPADAPDLYYTALHWT